MVTKEIFDTIVAEVKVSCAGAVAALNKELIAHFLASNLMDALGICYPQYWCPKDCENNSDEKESEKTFPLHLNFLKA
jgi:hypothetical protein